MAKSHHPRRGSMQYWPRKRSRASVARIGAWANSSDAKPLGFIGYKAGMTHVMAEDKRSKSITKGETLALASTIVECPAMHVIGAVFYKPAYQGLRKNVTVLAQNLPKSLSRSFPLTKKQHSFDNLGDFSDVRILVASEPSSTGNGAKKPKVLEIGLGGDKDAKLAYAQEHLGKTLSVADVLGDYAAVDVHGITKGKGFQGTVKRFGVAIRSHKSEKVKRGIGNLGAWTPSRVDYRTPQPGKMGYHLRTEHNKQVLEIGEDGARVTRKGGITKYGEVRNNYVLLKGSVQGPRKRAVVLSAPIRPNKKFTKGAYEVKHVRI